MKLEWRVVELERKLENIVRVGTVSALDAESAKVKVKSGGILTKWLRWISRRAGVDREWWSPESGEQVVLLAPSGDLAQAVVLPSIYQDAFSANSNDTNIHRIDYGNDNYLEHNRKTGVMTIKCSKLRIIAPVEQTGGDMTSDGISAQHHPHTDVVRGKDKSGKPIK